MEPTGAQIRASGILDRHLAVTAGPGSGKTRVLVSRYLNILEREGARVENIVAITFTNKAANEMRERLRREIDARIEEHRKSRFEAEWRDRKRRLEGAVITTIHGFCSRLLRENPVEAVVDPQFTTLDDYTASVLLDASAQAAVTDLIDADDALGAQLVAAYGRATLVGHLVAVYNTMRGLGVSIDEAERRTEAGMATASDLDGRIAAVADLVDRAYAIADTELKASSRTNAKARIDAFAEMWSETRPELEVEPTVENADAFLAALRRAQEGAPSKRIAMALRPWVDSLRELIGDTRDRAPAGAVELAYFDACAGRFAPVIFKTLRGLDALYSMEKRAAAALDYEDLQLRARDLLAANPAVARRVRTRYRFFLVDEFQDTNNLQREIIDLVALGEPRANLFIVGDRKQSIYGFRGAEVEVFSKAVADVERDGGEAIALATNFRSDGRLVAFFNAFFGRLMRAEPDDDADEIESLGFVAYEPGDAHRTPADDGPAVEVLLDVPVEDGEEDEDEVEDERAREREARRLAARIAALVETAEPCVLDRVPADEPALRPARYADVAILLRAMSDVKTYERALRREGVPYYVVAGKGFYDRPETSDVLNLLEFVDNRTDELALAAVLRSPLFGVSDDTLLALRVERLGADGVHTPNGVESRTLYDAVLDHRSSRYVTDDQHAALEEAAETLSLLLDVRNRVPISELIREALRLTGYEIVAAAAEDGAQRLSNLDKLVAIARQFERGSLRLLRDFIEYIRDFRRLEAREAEAYLRSDRDAVAILTVHKAKGLEFPVVVVPDLQRELSPVRSDVLFDRNAGLAFKVPDGRGGLTRTGLYTRIAERKQLRERFESIRALYVAATRAQDLLLFSGATNRRPSTEGKPLRSCASWLHWVVGVLGESGDPFEPTQTLIPVGESTVRVIGPRIPILRPVRPAAIDEASDEPGDEPAIDPEIEAFRAVEHVRRMLGTVAPIEERSLQRYPATALQSFANCPRQFYYTRLLRIPGADSRSGRDLAERSEQAETLPASLRGLVIHRFCETLLPGDDVRERLRASLRDVRTARGDAYAEVFAAFDEEASLSRLEPLARNYVASPMRMRVDERLAAGVRLPTGQHEFVLSELAFTLRVPEGFIHGTIDKVLLTPLASGRMRATVVDFKTGRVARGNDGLAAGVERAASEHLLQIQIYAQAVRRLVPGVTVVEATLHFLQPGPGVEYDLSQDLVAEARTAKEIERVLTSIGRGGYDPVMFEARPGERCRRCAFAGVCPEGLAYATPEAATAEA